MFKTTTKTDSAPTIQTNSALTSTGSVCMISKGATLEGKFTSEEDLQLNGTIKGEIFCKKRLMMGATGWVEGTINTQSAVIKGMIKGTIIVQGVLHLESTAKIEGIILAKTLQVESGAQYSGECKIGERFIKEGQKNLAAVA